MPTTVYPVLLCYLSCIVPVVRSKFIAKHSFSAVTISVMRLMLLVCVYPILSPGLLQALCLPYQRLLLTYALLCWPSKSSQHLGQLHLERRRRVLLFHWITPPTPQSCTVTRCNWVYLLDRNCNCTTITTNYRLTIPLFISLPSYEGYIMICHMVICINIQFAPDIKMNNSKVFEKG